MGSFGRLFYLHHVSLCLYLLYLYPDYVAESAKISGIQENSKLFDIYHSTDMITFCSQCCNNTQGLNGNQVEQCGFQELIPPVSNFPLDYETNIYSKKNDDKNKGIGFLFNGGLVSQGSQLVAAYQTCTTQCSFNNSILSTNNNMNNETNEISFNGYFYQYNIDNTLQDMKGL